MEDLVIFLNSIKMARNFNWRKFLRFWNKSAGQPTPIDPPPTEEPGPSLDNPAAFQAEFLGFNPGWTWNVNSPNLAQTSAYAMGALRFPAGTLGNYYHYATNGYGLVQSEMDVVGDSIPITDHTGQNYIIDFADYAVSEGITQVIYMAGLFFQRGGSPREYQEHLDAIQYLESRGLTVVGVQAHNETNFDKYSVLYPSDWALFKTHFLEFVADLATIGSYDVGVQIPNIQNRNKPRAQSFYDFVTTDTDITSNIDFYNMHLYPTTEVLNTQETAFLDDLKVIQAIKPVRFTEFNVNGEQGSSYTYRGLQHAKDLWRIYLLLLDAGAEMLFVHNLYGQNVNAFYNHNQGTSTMAELWKELTFLLGSQYEVVLYENLRALRATSGGTLYTVFSNTSDETIRIVLSDTATVKVLNETGFDIYTYNEFYNVQPGDLVIISE